MNVNKNIRLWNGKKNRYKLKVKRYLGGIYMEMVKREKENVTFRKANHKDAMRALKQCTKKYSKALQKLANK